MKKDKIRKILKEAILIFLALSPIFDTVFFYNRVTTLIRILLIFIFLIITILINKNKGIKNLLIYYFLCILYLIGNLIHSKGFYSLFPNNFNYNFLFEFLTIIKLSMPFTLYYIIKNQNYNKKDFLKIFKIWMILIPIIIIGTNIFKISLSTYGSIPIKYNIFEWSSNLHYTKTASKGFFIYANQEAVILVMMLIVSIYLSLINKKNIIYTILISISMIMLGTRISTQGGLIILLFLLIMYIIFNLIKHRKIKTNIYLLIPIIIVWCLILPISPNSNRLKEINKAYINTIPYESTTIENNPEKERKMRYVLDNYNPEKLPKFFFEEYYDYNYDYEFWYEFIKNTPDNKINYRYIENKIIKRVYEIDNRNTNLFLGISNSRIQNIVNIEKDFVLHFYAFGIFGSFILLFFYLYINFLNLLKFLKDRTFLSFIILFNSIMFCFIALLSGNIINSMTTIIAFQVFLDNFNMKEYKNL